MVGEISTVYFMLGLVTSRYVRL